MRTVLNDESGQVLRRVFVYAVIFALFILLIVELGPLAWDRFSVSQTADDTANSAANTYMSNHDEAQVISDVTTKLKLSGLTDEEVRQCQILFLPPGPGAKLSLKVTVVMYARSYLLEKIGFLKKLSKITATKEVGLTK